MTDRETISVPRSWSVAGLESLADISYGKALSADMRSDEGEVPVIGSSGVVGCHNEALVEGPCLVVGRKGAAGAVHLVTQPSWPIDTAYFIQPAPGVDLRYLYHFLSSQELGRLDKSTAIPSLSRDDLYKVEVPVAPRAEQTRIVEKLEELLSGLDDGVAELKAAQLKLTQYRQSLLKAAVEGVLTADWRATNKPKEAGAALLQRILTERRARWEQKQLAKFVEQEKTPPKDWKAKYPQPLAPDVVGLPSLPKGWVWASVDQIGEIQLGRQRSPDKLTGTNPTKYIRAANITEQGINFSDVLEMDFDAAERARFSLKEGDVLLTEASGSPEHVGRPVIWPSVDGEYCFQNTVLRFSSPAISPQYAFRMFQAAQKLGQFQKLAGGVGINHLSAGKLSRHVVPIPSLEEQGAIVRALDEAFASIEQQEDSTRRGLRLCAAQRRNFLRAAFSGQLVPQDKNDESASILLARIRIENSVRTKSRRTHSMKKRVAVSSIGADQIREWIKGRDYFTFEELRGEVPASYQILRDSLFALLAEQSPLIEQEFVPEPGVLRFKRIRG